MGNLLNNLVTAVVFLTIISILVAAHEYGHYLFARIFKMGVEEFAIGMGKKLRIWRRTYTDVPVPAGYQHDPSQMSHGAAFEGGSKLTNATLVQTDSGPMLREETEFTVRMLPIGGFVRIKGMIPQDDGSEVGIPGGFYSKPPWQRLIVLLAGPAASVLSGILVLVAIFMIHGAEKPVTQPVLGIVYDGSIAASAGLKAGDRIVAVNGKPISTFYELVHGINSNPEKQITLDYLRNSKTTSVKVTPALVESETMGPDLEALHEITKHGAIGIAPKFQPIRLGIVGATQEAVRAPIEAVAGIFRIARKPSSLKNEAGGVIVMVSATSAAVQAGMSQVFWLAAMLSISVGIFNLLPIPPLDGGQMVMAFAELLRGGKRLSIQVQQTLMNTGVLLVLLLFVVVMFVDIQRFTGNAKSPVAAPSVTSHK